MGVRVITNSYDENDDLVIGDVKYPEADSWTVLDKGSSGQGGKIFHLEVTDTENDRLVAYFKQWDRVEVFEDDATEED